MWSAETHALLWHLWLTSRVKPLSLSCGIWLGNSCLWIMYTRRCTGIMLYTLHTVAVSVLPPTPIGAARWLTFGMFVYRLGYLFPEFSSTCNISNTLHTLAVSVLPPTPLGAARWLTFRMFVYGLGHLFPDFSSSLFLFFSANWYVPATKQSFKATIRC